MPFVTTAGEYDASQLNQEIIELLEAKFEGWQSAEGSPITWLAKAFARIGSDVFAQEADLETVAFKRFGEAIIGIPPVQAAPATVETTWTLTDEDGHEIPAGTLVSLLGPNGQPVMFETVGVTIVAPGSTKATILLQAVEPGAGSNDLSEEPTLVSSLSFVQVPSGIELEGATANGVDEEEEDAYLDRLVETLRLLSISLILPEDFEVDARAVAGIDRCKCIRGYDAETEEADVPLCVTVFPIDAEGAAASALLKEELEERQRAKLLSGVNYFVADPDFTEFDVVTQIVVAPGFDEVTVISSVEARLAEYLDPAKWGLPTSGESSGWVNRTTLYVNELISEIDRVGGVERVISVKIAKHEGTPEAKDLELAGVAPLARPGTIEVGVE